MTNHSDGSAVHTVPEPDEIREARQDVVWALADLDGAVTAAIAYRDGDNLSKLGRALEEVGARAQEAYEVVFNLECLIDEAS
jgi:hypothetical protein